MAVFSVSTRGDYSVGTTLNAKFELRPSPFSDESMKAFTGLFTEIEAKKEKDIKEGGNLTYSSKLVSNNDDMCKAMGLSGKLSCSYGPFTGSGELDFAKDNSMSSNDTAFVVTAIQSGHYIRCDLNDRNVLKLRKSVIDQMQQTEMTAADFRIEYGEYLIIGFEYGGKLNFISKYKADSQDEKMAIHGKLSVGIDTGLLKLTGDASIDVDESESKVQINADVEMKLFPSVLDQDKDNQGVTSKILSALTQLAQLDSTPMKPNDDQKEETSPNKVLLHCTQELFSGSSRRMNVILIPLDTVTCVAEAFRVAENQSLSMSIFFAFVTPLYLDISSMILTITQFKEYYKANRSKDKCYAAQRDSTKAVYGKWSVTLSAMNGFFENLGAKLPLLYLYAEARGDLLTRGDTAKIPESKYTERNKGFILTHRSSFKELFYDEIEEPHEKFMASLPKTKPREKKVCGLVKQIELKVSKHRGHSFGDQGHPRNLLDGKGTETGYYSKYGESAIGDWIEFVMSEEAVVVPTKIRIRNDDGRMAIKVISLFIGVGDDSWHKLVDDVTDIQKQDDYEQEFVFGELLVTPQWIGENNAKHIRMEVRQNYGNKENNAFYGFRLFGCAIWLQ